MADLRQNTWETDSWYAQYVAGNAEAKTPAAAQGLYWWGKNTDGVAGLNQTSTGNYSSPVQVSAVNVWDRVSSGSYAMGWIKADGTLWVTGRNSPGGILGLNDNDSNQRYSSPVQVGTDSTWGSIFFGRHGAAGVKTDGTLWTWGNNPDGMLGHNQPTGTTYSSPKQVGTNTTWSTAVGHLDGGFTRFGGIKTDGTLWIWGNGGYGQIGKNDEITRSSPTQVPGTFTKLTGLGGANTSAIKSDGTLWVWGSSNQGNLGLNQSGTPAHRSSPTQIPGAWAQVYSGGLFSTLAIKTDGSMWSWGDNENGELGLNVGGPYQGDTSSPAQVGTATDWEKVKGGGRMYMASKTDKTLWSWGKNLNGQAGQNVTGPGLSSPTQLPGNWTIANWTSTAYNAAYGCAFKVE